MLLFTADNKKDLNRLYWAIELYYIGNTAVVFGCRIWQCDAAFTRDRLLSCDSSKLFSLGNSSLRRLESVLIPPAPSFLIWLCSLALGEMLKSTRRPLAVPSFIPIWEEIGLSFVPESPSIWEWENGKITLWWREPLRGWGEARGFSQCRSIYQFTGIGPVIYLSGERWLIVWRGL